MKPRTDFDKIIEKRKKMIGVLNYNFMIPVGNAQLQKVELKPSKKDSESEKYYK